MGNFVADTIVLAVVAWQAGAGAATSQREKNMDLHLARLLDEERKRSKRLSHVRVVPGPTADALRTVDVVPDEILTRWGSASRHSERMTSRSCHGTSRERWPLTRRWSRWTVWWGVPTTA